MNEILLFVIAFILPFVYYRTLYFVYRNYFKIAKLRAKSGLQIHHLHYGALLITASSFILLLQGKNFYSISFLGIGLGMIMDEFALALLMPGDRKVEMESYRRGFIPTLIIFAVLI
ncbi:MAG: hypothetical protein AABW50_02645, partial [Nanoarchaeota archaeon]